MKPAINLFRLIGIASVLGACNQEAPPAPDTAVPVRPVLVSLSATEYAIQAPDSVPAGWTTLRFANHGQELHYAHIVRLDSGKTVSELVGAYAEAIRTSGPRPSWVTRFGGPGGTAPGDSASVTQLLEPGSYVWICPVEDDAGSPHFGKGEFKSFVVYPAESPLAVGLAAPEAAVTIRLLDFSFDLGDSLPSGQYTVRVQNAGVEPHDLVLMKLAPGVTVEELERWLNPERARRPGEAEEPPPPMESIGTPVGGVAAIRPTMEAFFEADISPGEYVLMCMATAPDGRSHIEHGMIRPLSVR